MDAAGDSAAEDDDASTASQPSHLQWKKGVSDPSESRVNIWSLNGFGEPVFTGGMYRSEEAKKLERTVKEYCASKSVTLSELCGGQDHTVHDKRVRGAWQEIAQCLPHRTVLSVYRRALRQFHGMQRGKWSEEEVSTLFRLVELHGRKWATIQDKLGRSATDCRVKFLAANENFERGRWSVENVELLLTKVRSALNVPDPDMDVREINRYTLERNTKIPWTAVSCRVNRSRTDCYFKWKQMTKRSNKKAKALGIEPMPMARESMKIDVRREFVKWKAEQDPKWRERYTEEFVRPQFLQDEEDEAGDWKKRDLQLLDGLIESRASRPSEVSWQANSVQRGDPRERWDHLVDRHAKDDELDLPLWKLAAIVKEAVAKTDYDGIEDFGLDARNESSLDNQQDEDDRPKKEKKRKWLKKKKQKESPSPPDSPGSSSSPRRSDVVRVVDGLFRNSDASTSVKDIYLSVASHFGIPKVDKETRKIIKDRLTELATEARSESGGFL
ncbi:hypothetical protein ACHAXT_006664 [Thalassiosira profunda]